MGTAVTGREQVGGSWGCPFLMRLPLLQVGSWEICPAPARRVWVMFVLPWLLSGCPQVPHGAALRSPPGPGPGSPGRSRGVGRGSQRGWWPAGPPRRRVSALPSLSPVVFPLLCNRPWARAARVPSSLQRSAATLPLPSRGLPVPRPVAPAAGASVARDKATSRCGGQ